MIKKYLSRLVLLVIFTSTILYVLKITAPDPKFNHASFETEPMQSAVLDPSLGWTLAQTKKTSGAIQTLLVTHYDSQNVTAINLHELGAIESDNPFEVLASLDQEQLVRAASGEAKSTARPIKVPFSELISVAGNANRHLATGTNFPEHAEEAASDSVFNFPKFGRATPARTTVDWIAGGLLDYEVELCLRFDRPITSIADFDAATKGFFLCGDFTERATLLRLIDPQNLDSGNGFSDAKSGPGFFPSGALLVVPNDWRSFIAQVRMTTSMNGHARQDARGSEMILDFRQLTQRVLADMHAPRFLFNEQHVKLAPNMRIDSDMILMSGTSEGVIFTMPTRADLIDGLFSYLSGGAFLADKGVYQTLVDSFINSEMASEHFLQPGDLVEFSASSLGNIVVEVQ